LRFFFTLHFSPQGITDNVRGPSILDLGEVYQSAISTVSGLFLAAFLGSLCGSVFSENGLECESINEENRPCFQPDT